MAKYRIEIKRSAAKEIEKLPTKILNQILDRIKDLENNPRPINSKKLSGKEQYRLRNGDYRILYLIDDGAVIIYIVKVGHRREVYR